MYQLSTKTGMLLNHHHMVTVLGPGNHRGIHEPAVIESNLASISYMDRLLITTERIVGSINYLLKRKLIGNQIQFPWL